MHEHECQLIISELSDLLKVPPEKILERFKEMRVAVRTIFLAYRAAKAMHLVRSEGLEMAIRNVREYVDEDDST